MTMTYLWQMFISLCKENEDARPWDFVLLSLLLKATTKPEASTGLKEETRRKHWSWKKEVVCSTENIFNEIFIERGNKIMKNQNYSWIQICLLYNTAFLWMKEDTFLIQWYRKKDILSWNKFSLYCCGYLLISLTVSVNGTVFIFLEDKGAL